MRVLDKDITLRPGMSMTADIETETRQDVLAVPIQSVTTRMPKADQQGPAGEGQASAPSGGGMAAARARTENRPKEIVFVVDGGAVKAIPVKRGISNDTHVEITEGLSEGAQVVSGSYRAINRELEDGAKVRIEEPKKEPGKTGGEGSS
jgi:HlyD family secretion protein